MAHEDLHLADQSLLMDIEGELPAREQARVRSHLEACWECRGRRRAIEDAIAEYTRFHQREFEEKLPPADGPRALLRAQLAHLASKAPRTRWFTLSRPKNRALAAALCVIGVVGFIAAHWLGTRWTAEPKMTAAFSVPDPRLTPGAAVLASKQTVCSQRNIKNKAVTVALQRQVFEEYGISQAAPQAYEVDYLVTPALGGADDLRNLWPHSYVAQWNAHVKDALEDRLREMVCDGNLDLAVAQKEIAENWIGAYKKYFHTDQPLVER